MLIKLTESHTSINVTCNLVFITNIIHCLHRWFALFIWSESIEILQEGWPQLEEEKWSEDCQGSPWKAESKPFCLYIFSPDPFSMQLLVVNSKLRINQALFIIAVRKYWCASLLLRTWGREYKLPKEDLLDAGRVSGLLS